MTEVDTAVIKCNKTRYYSYLTRSSLIEHTVCMHLQHFAGIAHGHTGQSTSRLRPARVCQKVQTCTSFTHAHSATTHASLRAAQRTMHSDYA